MDTVDFATYRAIKEKIAEGEFSPTRKDQKFLDSLSSRLDIDLTPEQSDWLGDIWERATGQNAT